VTPIAIRNIVGTIAIALALFAIVFGELIRTMNEHLRREEGL
jgi:hypothetical protein